MLKQHFTHAPEPRWRGDLLALEPPDRLVFLLDHQYTERGLHWSHLKGDDAARAAVIASAAELAGCDLGLAHAEIHETWECYDDTPSRRGRSRYWDDEPHTDPDGFELGDLIESTVQITAAHGGAVAFDPDVNAAELAAATPSAELAPKDTEYTGYMGNWGNTMDRWYRRAAIVIWPRTRAFALQAKGDPVAAVHQILATIDRHRGARQAGRDPRRRLRRQPVSLREPPPPPAQVAHRGVDQQAHHHQRRTEEIVSTCLKGLDRFRLGVRVTRLSYADLREERRTACVWRTSSGILRRIASTVVSRRR